MGNTGTKETTLENTGDSFVQTGDGIKLSTTLIEKLSSTGGATLYNSAQQSDESEQEAARQRQEYQAIIDAREKEISRLQEESKDDVEKERLKYSRFHQLTLDEVNQAAAEVKKQLKDPSLIPVCQKQEKNLLECYSNNSGKILNCASHLKELQTCVNNAKEAMLKKSKASAGA